ncbi:ZIP family zinc transporter [Diaporthe amygdali]|uniref:ZIP family zinc transporter n=1 Tax=Phomopsis amygdali TaxID=1214568 RepID=UPI0022FEE632|nr:ZIP family zinc transporter [Diaporthe amygdali]KAJ0122619.1 ZIP family zinc transporter [Diaporthe amygdali]
MDNLTQLATDISWSSLPTEWLLAELAKRDDVADSKPQCGSGRKGSYDTFMHVFALVLILALTCGFPLISSHSRSRRSNSIVFYSQHFGTGVLIATAFVHLLPTAFQSLNDPCLPYFFSKGYRPLPGFIAMVSAGVVVAIESYLTTRGARHSHSHMWEDDESDDERGAHSAHSGGILAARRGLNRPTNIALEDLGASEGLMAGASPLPESTPTLQVNGKSSGVAGDSTGRRHDNDDEDRESMDLELNMDELSSVPLDGENSRSLMKPDSAPKSPTVPHMPNPEEQRRLMLQCLLLEAGILFHSVFIGMAISVATGPPFVVFLVAIAFHQTFEGLALGSRIAGLHLPKSSPRPWLMVLAYGTTTPIGQAIGLIVHNFYDPMSQTGLLMVGFMNAISSGLLLFAGLVQLLAEDFLTEKSYKTLHGRRRINAFIAVAGGSMLMALVGAFA